MAEICPVPFTFPKSSGSFLGITILDIFLAPNWPFMGSRAVGGYGQPSSPPPPSPAQYGVVGVRLGRFEGWWVAWGRSALRSRDSGIHFVSVYFFCFMII